jgi:hypothetical protein
MSKRAIPNLSERPVPSVASIKNNRYIGLSPDKLALYIDKLLLNLVQTSALSRLQRQAAPAIANPKDDVPEKNYIGAGVLPISDTGGQVFSQKNVKDAVVRDAISPAVSATETSSLNKQPSTLSYQSKANDPLYVHYSLWSVFSIVNTSLVDDPDLVAFVASVSALVAVSLAAKLAPERFNPKLAKAADKLVIGVSGVRDASRIMTTFALGYWTLALHASEEVIQPNIDAGDIILGAAADPLFWAMIGVIGIANGVLKYRAKTNPEGLSSSMAALEKGVRGAYMACSTSTMAILMLDCMTSLLSSAVKSGYGLLLAEPVTAAVTFAIIATVAVAGAYCGVTAQREPQRAMAKTFDKCDKTLATVRKIFMPIAVIASLLRPELVILGAVLAIASLLYSKYRQRKNEGEVEQKDALADVDGAMHSDVSEQDMDGVSRDASEQEWVSLKRHV